MYSGQKGILVPHQLLLEIVHIGQIDRREMLYPIAKIQPTQIRITHSPLERKEEVW